MAATRSGNTWYVTTSDETLEAANLRVVALVLAAGGSASEALLGDARSDASYPNKLRLTAPANDTIYLELKENPLVFPNGIRVKALTAGASITLILGSTGT
jgi:hypothetical protein